MAINALRVVYTNSVKPQEIVHFWVKKNFFKKIEKNLKKGLTKWSVYDIIIWHSERAPKKALERAKNLEN